MIFFIVCLIVLLIIGFLIFFIEVKIEAKDLEIKIKDKNFKMNENGKITIRFTILNKIDLFKFTTNINRFKSPESKNKNLFFHSLDNIDIYFPKYSKPPIE